MKLLTQEMKKMKNTQLTKLLMLTPIVGSNLAQDKSNLLIVSQPEAAFV